MDYLLDYLKPILNHSLCSKRYESSPLLSVFLRTVEFPEQCAEGGAPEWALCSALWLFARLFPSSAVCWGARVLAKGSWARVEAQVLQLGNLCSARVLASTRHDPARLRGRIPNSLGLEGLYRGDRASFSEYRDLTYLWAHLGVRQAPITTGTQGK
jgi:hypothetical protein